jgi:hypothetical protein
MQKSIIALLVATALSVLAPLATAEEQSLKLDDFSYGANLTSAESEFMRFTLTPNMVKDIQRRDLGDVRVFDGNNELMPSLAKKKGGNIKTSQQSLTFYRHLVSGKTKGYILDRTAKHKQSLKSLHLLWKRGSAPNVLFVRVEHSEDKKNWKTLKDSEAISNFKFGGVELKQNVIDINDHTKRYVRLTFLDTRKAPALKSAIAYNTDKKPSDYFWITAGKLRPYEGMSNSYRFSVSKGISPDFLKMSFGKLNSMLSGSLYTLNTIDGKPERKLAIKNFDAYVVTRNNKVVKSKPVDVSKWQSSEWLITINTAVNVSEENLPGATVAYPQYDVIFANDGEAPYTAVWGYSNAGAPMAGDVVERIKTSKLTWKDIAVVTPGSMLNTAALTELMESRQTPWLMLLIGLLIVIIAVAASVFGYQRYQSARKT